MPEAVISVVGGGKTGGATLTTPVNTATAGPMATGKPVTYTVTNADGSTTTSTTGPNSSNGSSSEDSTNVGAIVAGCVAGFFFVLACYLAFCAWVYRKQLHLYKRHVEMAQAQARGEKIPAIPGLLATDNSSKHTPTTPSDPSWRRGDQFGPWATNTSDSHSRNESGGGSSHGHQQRFGLSGVGAANGGVGGYSSVRRNSEDSGAGEDDLLQGREPTFFGVLLNPRKSLRVVNQD